MAAKGSWTATLAQSWGWVGVAISKVLKMCINCQLLFKYPISSLQGVGSSIRSNQCAKIFVKIHYLLLSSHQFGKGTVDMDFSLMLHTSAKWTMMLLSKSGSPSWSPWGHRSRASSWTFSPTSGFHWNPPCYLPPVLCLKPEITFFITSHTCTECSEFL